jgi:hypothetical protein
MSNEATFPISVDKTAETDVGSVLAVPRRSEGDVSEFGRPRGSASASRTPPRHPL